MPDAVMLTLGHGYAAAALAASLPAHWARIGTTRSADKARAMRAAGVEPVDWADAAAVEAAIGRASHVVVSVAPDAAGCPVLARHGEALGPGRWLGYLSTTGVYGDRQGGWVAETSRLAPVNERSHWRAAAEAEWRARGAEVFRLAGIYGPGRSAIDRLRQGRAQRVVKPGQVFSRIHVEDIAGALIAAMARPEPGRVVNLADNEPAPPQDVIAFAATLLGIEAPGEVDFDAAELSQMARSFYADNKRVCNRRLRETLGVALIHPDYRAGLKAILDAEPPQAGNIGEKNR